MAATATLSREEKIGLLLAGTAHVALTLVLIVHRPEPKPYTPPERITVSLSEEVALDTSAPDPSDNPAAAMAPELAPVPQPPVAAPPPVSPPPQVRPTARPTPAPTPTATRRPSPAPTATRRPSPAPTATRRPSPAPTARPAPSPAPAASSRPAPAPSATRSGGAPSVGADFLDGATNTTGDRGQAGDQPNAQQQASIASAIIRQLKPHWSPPSGVDVERLVTVVRFRLNRDGSLDGAPEVVRQTGVNDNNRLQAPRHAEQAIRAVRLAAPFDLPDRFYSGWRVVTSNFDNRLAQ